MRTNLPVTNIEYVLKDTEMIVSKTKLNGKITYINQDFINISGFAEEELIGAPQNIVRHPDIPLEAFEDFWRTIKSGKAWTGLVKNHCENGNNYWVEANAAPMLENVQIVGYTSIRVNPSREQIEQAGQASRRIKAGDKTLEIREGEAVPRSFFSRFSLLARISGFLIYRSVVTPLERARRDLERMSAGDLTGRIESAGADEMAKVLQALRVLQTNVKLLVGQIKETTDLVTNGAQEIARGNIDLSARTESQASAGKQTASSMEELTSTVKQNADNAREANQLVALTSDIARKGGRAVGQGVKTMGSIKEGSSKIADIIGVIDGIAFQTNILALNAAAKAARAGEQGHGFAVVAAEVRNLAQRSAEAAKEIKSLIVDSFEKVDAGSKLVDEAGHTMDEIVASVEQVTSYVSDISAASVEQSSRIEQVNQAVMQMDETTQRNAALVEEAAAAAESLQEQAVKLTYLLNSFKLVSGGTAPQAAILASPHRREPRARTAQKPAPRRLAS